MPTEPDPPPVTKTGKTLTDADLEALAREAEIGYDIRPDGTADPVVLKLITTNNPAVWAYWFKAQFGDQAPDELTMTTWFAKALETGRNFGRNEGVLRSWSDELGDFGETGRKPIDSAPICPACGAVAYLRDGCWETDHEIDCAWMLNPESESYG